MEKQALERPRVLPKLHSQPPTYAVPWTPGDTHSARALRCGAVAAAAPTSDNAEFSVLVARVDGALVARWWRVACEFSVWRPPFPRYVTVKQTGAARAWGVAEVQVLPVPGTDATPWSSALAAGWQ